MPGDAGQLATTFGPTAAILLVMWLNRNPTKEDKKADPFLKIHDNMETALDLLEGIKTDMAILKDRGKR